MGGVFFVEIVVTKPKMTMVALNMMLTRHISEGFASDFEHLLTGELTAIKKSVEIKSSSIRKYSDDALEIF